MALPFRFQQSALPLPYGRERHLAVTWKNAVIVWGGQSISEDDAMSVVYYHISGKWIKKLTSGDMPECNSIGTKRGHVIEDKLYVLDLAFIAVIYCLDLETWIWSRFTPNGTPPATSIWAFSSWAYKGKIFCFGGNINFGRKTNQLFCYNVSNNSWEWPEQKGDIPSPRMDHLTVISGESVFLFGGITNQDTPPRYIHDTDLYILDMQTLKWDGVNGNIGQPWPTTNVVRSKGTLTLISLSAAILFTEYECWLMNLNSAKQLQDPSSIWTPIPNNFNKMIVVRAAVVEPVREKLWFMGGYDLLNHCYISDVLVMSFKLSLREFAVDRVARCICPHDPRLAPDKCPKLLREEIDSIRPEIGENISCGQFEDCPVSQPTKSSLR